MKCLIAVAVLLCLALAPAASAAQRPPRFYRLGVADGPAVSDGIRDVAFLNHAPSAVFYDFGNSAPHGIRVDPPPCPQAQSRGGLAAAGAGKLTWDCGEFDPLVEDVATGQIVDVHPDVGLGSEGGFYPGAIGGRWLKVNIHENHVSLLRYFNLATASWRSEPSSPRQYANLDSPKLAQTMCRPLRRQREPEDSGAVSLFHPYFYERPYGVGVHDFLDAGDQIVSQRITVQRCGSRRVTTVGRCTPQCTDVQFASGMVTWADTHAFRAYVPRSRKHYVWPLGSFRPGLRNGEYLGHPSIVHTGQRLIASIPPPASSQQKWTIWAARTPRLR